MNKLQRCAHGLEQINEWIGRALSWSALLMGLVTFSIVFLRYGFNLGWIWLQESALYLHALLFMGCAGYTLRHDRHVRVDLFYRRWSKKGRAWVDLLGSLLLLGPVCLLLLYQGYPFVADSWQVREASMAAGGLPAVFLLKTLVLLFPLLLLLQGGACAIRAFLCLKGVE